MSETEILDQIIVIIRKSFSDPALAITKDTTAADVRGWNSLAHVRLMLGIERAFNLRFSAAAVANLNSVGDICTLVEAGKRHV